MTLDLHVPGTTRGWLRRRDARWKLAATAVAGLAIVLLREPRPIVAAVLAATVLAGSTAVRGLFLARRLAPIALMLVFFFGWTVFVPRASEEAVMLGPLALSPQGCAWLTGALGKTLALLILVMTLLETTPLAELGYAARSLGVPRVLVQLFLMTQRYVFLLAEEFGRLRTALRVRGFRGYVNPHTYRTIGHVAGTLLVRSHDRAERVHQAMRCRGFEGKFRTLEGGRTATADVGVLLGGVLLAASLLGWDRGWPLP